jgi:hypothetical protein
MCVTRSWMRFMRMLVCGVSRLSGRRCELYLVSTSMYIVNKVFHIECYGLGFRVEG